MKKHHIIFILLLAFFGDLFPQQPKEGDYNLVSTKIKSCGNKLLSKSWDGYKSIFYLDFYNGNKWQTIPNKIIKGQDTLTIPFNLSCGVDIDKNENIWTSAGGFLWKYDGFEWKNFNIDDTLKDKRLFYDLTIDSSGNVWVLTKVEFVSKVIYDGGTKYIFLSKIYHEILKFDGNNFNIMMRVTDSSEGANNLTLFDKITTAPNGSIYLHKNVSINDLMIYDGKSWNYETIYYQQINARKFVNKIFIDNDNNLWVSFGTNGSPCGVSLRNNDGKWKYFSTDDGMPTLDGMNQAPVLSATKDINGDVWLATYKEITKITKDLKVHNLSLNDIFANGILFRKGADFSKIDWKYPVMYDITITEGNKLWIATINGLLLYEISPPNKVEEEKELEFITELYPNTITNESNTKLIVKSRTNIGDIELSLIDITGKLLYCYKETSINSLYYEYVISTDALTSGIYYLVIRNNRTTKQLPLIITK